MSLKAMYQNVATRYAVANQFGSISRSHACAIEQIQNSGLGCRPNCKILDLGVGDGLFLKELKKSVPHGDFTGIDISDTMLAQAEKALKLRTIEASATEACQYLPHHSQDLVVAHFINAYIPVNELFHQAKILTRANGHFSLITTTYESFPVAQQHLAEFIAQNTLVSRFVGHYYKAVLQNSTVAPGQDELLKTFEQNRFEVDEHYRLEVPIMINNIDELITFGIEGTWFLNSLSVKLLPKNFLRDRLKKLFNKIFTFPYQDTHIIDIVLAKK